MELTIYQCDNCGADCSEYEKRVMVYFPHGERHELCIECARKIFQDKEQSTNFDYSNFNPKGE